MCKISMGVTDQKIIVKHSNAFASSAVGDAKIRPMGQNIWMAVFHTRKEAVSKGSDFHRRGELSLEIFQVLE